MIGGWDHNTNCGSRGGLAQPRVEEVKKMCSVLGWKMQLNVGSTWTGGVQRRWEMLKTDRQWRLRRMVKSFWLREGEVIA